MRVLVIGGTYFAGRVFSIYASRKTGQISLTLVNRGSRPLSREGVEELIADRRDAKALASAVGGREFDAIVDFCAYEPGDIERVMDAGVSASRYIMLSTVNVYDPAAAAPISEEAKVSTYDEIASRPGYPPELVSYIGGKRLLEEEIVACSAKHDMRWTIIRPAFIYGPFDYTPRLLQYIVWAAHGEPLVFPRDSDARFSFIYVKDLANMLLDALVSGAACDGAFNAAAPDAMDWPRFEELIGALTDEPQAHEHLSLAEIDAKCIPIMFPIDTNEHYSGERLANELGGFEFTPFEQGLKETWDVFKDYV